MWLAITDDRLQSAEGRVSRGQGLAVSQVGKVQLMALVDICPVGPRKDYQLQVSSKVGNRGSVSSGRAVKCDGQDRKCPG